ncbi:MAG: exosortase/archaeosortase family protein [Phycisphaerales bacterium]|nr:exosortase/archaeosortase family protein [Phycisphaerales bacterium]
MSTLPVNMPRDAIVFDRESQIKTGVLALLFVLVFYPILLDLQYHWLHELDWSHGPIIPLFSIYLLYLNWDKIRRTPVRHTWVGLVLLLGALGAYQFTLFSLQFLFLRPVAMLVAVLGIAIYLCGLPVMRYGWLPWLYLFFAIPLPKRAYLAITEPLRQIAATVATSVLSLIPDLEIQRLGSTIQYMYQRNVGQVEVADACSGMRSTITLLAIGVAVTFMTPRPTWQRVIMLLSCVPIAMFCNVIRVIITSYLYIFVDPSYAEGTPHMVLGLVMMMIAFGMFQFLAWMLQHFVVETEVDETDDDGRPAAEGGVVAS